MKIIFTKEDLAVMARAIVIANVGSDKLKDICNVYLDYADNNNLNDLDIVVTDY